MCACVRDRERQRERSLRRKGPVREGTGKGNRDDILECHRES